MQTKAYNQEQMKLSDYGFYFSEKQKNIAFEYHRVLIHGKKVDFHPLISKLEVVNFISNLNTLVKDLRILSKEEIINTLNEIEKLDTYLRDLIIYSWVLPEDKDFSKMQILMKISEEIEDFIKQELSSPHYVPLYLIDLILPFLSDADFSLTFVNSQFEEFAFINLTNINDVEKEDFVPNYLIRINLLYYLKMNYERSTYLMSLIEPFIFDLETVKRAWKIKNSENYKAQLKEVIANDNYLRLFDKKISNEIKEFVKNTQ